MAFINHAFLWISVAVYQTLLKTFSENLKIRPSKHSTLFYYVPSSVH